MTHSSTGVLPDAVARDPRSEVALVFVTLADGLDVAAVQTWLTTLGSAVETLEARKGGTRTKVASAVVGLGTRFFARFPEFSYNNPHGVSAVPPLQGEVLTADVVLQITYTSESRKAAFVSTLWATRPVVASIEIEHGYSRDDGREAFGQLDGLHNLTAAQRRQRTQIDPNELPEEPAWLRGGCYGAYIKIEQAVDAWQQLNAADREQIIGRREVDGSRLDLPQGSNPRNEGEFADGAVPPPESHVRKVGPRGALHDQTLILRRGAPYLEEEGGVVRSGLQFVSYQLSLDDFDVVLNRWMLNSNFPSDNAGPDALVARGMLNFLRSSVYVVAPIDARFPGAGYFDPAPVPAKHRKARIHIRKSAVDANGQSTNAEVGDLEFTLIDPKTGSTIGAPARTNPAGRAVLGGATIGKQVVVRESANARFEPQPDLTVDVTERNQIVRLSNRQIPGTPTYGQVG